MPSHVANRVAIDWNLLDVASPINTRHLLASQLRHYWVCAPGYLGGLVWRDLGRSSSLRSNLTVTSMTAQLFWNRDSTTPVAPHRGAYWATKGNGTGYGTTPVLTDWYSNGTTSWTFACWWRRATTSSTSIAIGQGNTTQNHCEFLVWSDGIVYFLFPANSQAPDTSNTDCYPFYSNNDLNWHCNVYVYDGSLTGNDNRLKCWMDGIRQTLDFTGTNSHSIPPSINLTPAGNFELHRRVENTGESYTGYVNDLAIWGRPLTDADAVAWYHSSRRGHPQFLRWLRPFRARSAAVAASFIASSRRSQAALVRR